MDFRAHYLRAMHDQAPTLFKLRARAASSRKSSVEGEAGEENAARPD
jgi:hypothetical protein